VLRQRDSDAAELTRKALVTNLRLAAKQAQ
jgi:hypothetical protein